MKGDFTRSTFHDEKRYSSVRMQQGRVQMDADWNEEVDILNHIERTTRIDVIGHCGGPINDAGFEVAPDGGGDLDISPGRYYVEGILCEKGAAEKATGQVDLPNYALPITPATYLAYLDVWERHITALEDPEIRDVALGGPDTATRTKVLAQVKLIQVPADAICDDFDHTWVPADATSNGRLSARSLPGVPPPDPCTVPAKAGLRRLENQLYRVEIHQEGALGTATFKWSRENGSVLFAVDSQDGADKIILKNPPPDTNLGLAIGNWIELTDDERELRGEAGVLMEVANVDGVEVEVVLASISDPLGLMVGAIDLTVLGENPKVRRWESAGALTVEVPGANNGFIKLEDGVEIKFDPTSTMFRVGDYWQIPARVNLGDVIWPVDGGGVPEFQPRHGIHHYYCPLAILVLTAQAGWAPNPIDCRDLFPSLTDLPEGAAEGTCCCCGFTVGDGEISQGDFNSIQEAVNEIAQSGGSGHICLLPGIHKLRAAVVIEGMDISIAGCGRRSLILNNAPEPAFEIVKSKIRMSDLRIEGAEARPAAANLLGCDLVVIEACTVTNRQADGSLGNLSAIYFNVCDNVMLGQCHLTGSPAVVSASTNVQFLNNQARGGGFWLERGSRDVVVFGNAIRDGQLQGITLAGARLEPQTDLQDVQRIAIRDNEISSMRQSAIGSAVHQPSREALGQIQDVTISHNQLVSNALGPIDKAFDGQAQGGVVLHGVLRGRIHHNTIAGHGQGEIPACGICLTWSVGVEIMENHIAGNGLIPEPGSVIGAEQLQGGIFLLPVLGGTLDLQSDQFARPGRPAFMVHDNVVITPSGPCLAAYGYGPMSVRDNAFTSRAICIQPPMEDDPTGEFGKLLFMSTNVSIFNLGANARRSTKTLPLGGGAVVIRNDLLGPLTDLILASEEIGPTPAGHLAYHGNQSDQHGMQFDGEFANPTVVLVSFGDAAVQDNQSVCHLVEGRQLTDWLVLGETTRVQDNWVDEEREQALFSIAAFGAIFCHASHNQVAECIFAAGGNVRQIENQIFDAAKCRSLTAQFRDLLPAG